MKESENYPRIEFGRKGKKEKKRRDCHLNGFV
jgi:hypothetical protein